MIAACAEETPKTSPEHQKQLKPGSYVAIEAQRSKLKNSLSPKEKKPISYRSNSPVRKIFSNSLDEHAVTNWRIDSEITAEDDSRHRTLHTEELEITSESSSDASVELFKLDPHSEVTFSPNVGTTSKEETKMLTNTSKPFSVSIAVDTSELCDYFERTANGEAFDVCIQLDMDFIT